jgi:hypothetical protein
MVEDRREAEEIAAEVRRKGHPVTVREISAGDLSLPVQMTVG